MKTTLRLAAACVLLAPALAACVLADACGLTLHGPERLVHWCLRG
jgi:hypothetical protein